MLFVCEFEFDNYEIKVNLKVNYNDLFYYVKFS